ncbi:Pr6Pr family membrane protein [Rhodococcus aerolatus]
MQVAINATTPEYFGGSPVGRALNVFAFFTIQSNVLVGVTSAVLAVRLARTSTVFAVARLVGVVAITVTMVIYHLTLSGLVALNTTGQVANQLQHTVVPLLCLVGWLVLGPRGLTSTRVAALTVIFPLAYVVFTAVRGPLASDWYPYPFADVAELGYLRVAVNAVGIGVLFLALSFGASLLDRRLPGVRTRGRSAGATVG